MSEVMVCRQHGMSLKKAKQAAAEIAAELAEEFGFEYAWEGTTLTFRRSGVSGTISVGKKEIAIHAKLGMLLAVMRPKIEKEIHRFCDAHFGPQA